MSTSAEFILKQNYDPTVQGSNTGSFFTFWLSLDSQILAVGWLG